VVSKVEEQTLQEYNDWRRAKGMAPLAPKSGRKTRGIKVSDAAWNQLMLTAIEFGYTTTRGAGADPSRYTQGGSVSELMEAIGMGLYLLTPANEVPSGA